MLCSSSLTASCGMTGTGALDLLTLVVECNGGDNRTIVPVRQTRPRRVGIGLERNREERNRRERRLGECVGGHSSPRSSQHGDLVVFCRWSGFCNRPGHNLSSRRLAKGAR